MKLHGTMSVKNRNLYIGGVKCEKIAKKYSTPLYVFDEKLIRQNCREYVNYFKVKEKICKRHDITQNIYFRITPGIEAHTHEYIKTGQIDSKFGFALANGYLYEALGKIRDYKNISLIGLHAHIGYQIFEIDSYMDAVDIMMNLVKKIIENFNIEIKEIDLGGGIGVYYTKYDSPKTIKEFCESIINRPERACQKLKINKPILIIEPGRSIVANAGSTLYTIVSIKDIKDIRTYVSVDGGMTDNKIPKPAVVFIENGKAKLICKRQTYKDLISLEL
ncbi:diaminopimelate decarboxylase family protein [Romboutsia lituseburensis]|uniref:diaminopimelate decarboxylase family protein n=1 Tax=Romboutsia lituseburensis TaxID=1537 RepID=UPI00215AFD09|nr:hypothetical protein [Romboutsia lituseburensis]MCR8744645.1 hypothetical protein [Romboutsia lituseburensis]